MSNRIAISALARSAWRDFLRARSALFVFDIVFKLVEAWLLVPAAAVALAIVLSRAGHVAVSNRDILEFLLTPLGLLYAALFGTVAVAFLLFEQAGIMALADLADAAKRPPLMRASRAVFWKCLRVFRLGAVQAVLLALALVPFVAAAALTYVGLLSEYDISYYVNERPPAFWLAAGIGGLLLLAALAVCLWLCVRWAFALPVLLFEQQSCLGALRASHKRVRGVGWRVGAVLLGWLAVSLLVGTVVEAGFRLVAAAVLENAAERIIFRILLLLIAQGLILATLSFMAASGLGLLMRRLYLSRLEELGLPRPSEGEASRDANRPASARTRRLVYMALAVVLLAPVVLWVDISRQLAVPAVVLVTAHRGNSRAAPENTLSAIRKAIESGADYTEVDVRQTADGVIVLLHDRDLKRVAGLSRRIDELTYEEVRRLDVGSWFDPGFAGEQVPTLAEAINLCRGRIRMNIELKFFGPDRGLAQAVALLVRELDFESDCLVTSFDYDALRQANRHNPRLRTGLIVAHALGDVSRLEIDALSVRTDFLSDDLLSAAHRHGREVHVWTVNDARQMTRLLKRGVDNIITGDPDMAIRVRDEWASLTMLERLVLASRLLLGLNP
jgi:glycerophosphoryl diester phosphodiesterase